jgi:hypothetical protein
VFDDVKTLQNASETAYGEKMAKFEARLSSNVFLRLKVYELLVNLLQAAAAPDGWNITYIFLIYHHIAV